MNPVIDMLQKIVSYICHELAEFSSSWEFDCRLCEYNRDMFMFSCPLIMLIILDSGGKVKFVIYQDQEVHNVGREVERGSASKF